MYRVLMADFDVPLDYSLQRTHLLVTLTIKTIYPCHQYVRKSLIKRRSQTATHSPRRHATASNKNTDASKCINTVLMYKRSEWRPRQMLLRHNKPKITQQACSNPVHILNHPVFIFLVVKWYPPSHFTLFHTI